MYNVSAYRGGLQDWVGVKQNENQFFKMEYRICVPIAYSRLPQ